MPRIAAAILIAVAALALNGTLQNGAFAKDVMLQPAPVHAPVLETATPKSTKLLSLLMVLESLRQAPVNLEAPKV